MRMEVGKEERWGLLQISWDFIPLDLSVPSEETRVLGVITPPTLDQTQLLTENHKVHNAFLLYIVHCTYKPSLCAFLLLSLRTKFFIPAMHLFTALGLSSGSTGSTSTEGSTGRERGVIGTELSSSVVDMSVVNAGVFWRG